MVYLPVSHLTRTHDAWRPSRLAAAFRPFRDFVDIFGAAIRVARATESRRDPDPADLKTLGITRALPRYQ